MDLERGVGIDRGSVTNLENHQDIGFLSNIGPGFMEHHKVTNPTFRFKYHLKTFRPTYGPITFSYSFYLLTS